MPHISSCRLFKALGLVSQSHCDEPEPEPIDARMRIGAAQDIADAAAREYLDALLDASALSSDRTRSKDTSAAVAKTLVQRGVKAHDTENDAMDAKSRLLPGEKSQVLASRNGKWFAYVGDCNNKELEDIDLERITISTKPPLQKNLCAKVWINVKGNGGSYGVLDNRGDGEYNYQGPSGNDGIQLTDKGKIFTISP